MLTIALSGPADEQIAARIELARAGFTVIDTDYTHGLEADEGEAFVTVEGEDIDVAAASVRELGFRLRQHHGPPGELWDGRVSGVDEQLAELRAEVEALKARKAGDR